MGDDGATPVRQRREDFGDTYVEVEIWDVPVSERYPEGIKYSLQYGRGDDTIFRYDNFPDHPGVGQHHKHVGNDVVSVEFDGIEAHYKRFKQEVIDNGEDWN